MERQLLSAIIYQMNDVKIPTYQDLMLPTLEAIDQLGGSASNSELEELTPELAEVTDDQLAVAYPEDSSKAGGSKILHRLHWARTYMRKFGAIESSTQGISSITPIGRSFLEMDREEASRALHAEDSRVRREARQAKAVAAANEQPLDAESGEETDWKSELLSVLKVMDPYAFERLARRLLREAGFRNVEVTQKSDDGGIDGMGVYRMSLVSFPTYFQCKRYQGSVSAGTVRDFRGAMTERGEKGLIVTTGTFSPRARDEATRDGAPPIDLVDGDELCDLLKRYGLGVEVTTRTIEEVAVQPEFFETL